jgi:hypothetical protein
MLEEHLPDQVQIRVDEEVENDLHEEKEGGLLLEVGQEAWTDRDSLT